MAEEHQVEGQRHEFLVLLVAVGVVVPGDATLVGAPATHPADEASAARVVDHDPLPPEGAVGHLAADRLQEGVALASLDQGPEDLPGIAHQGPAPVAQFEPGPAHVVVATLLLQDAILVGAPASVEVVDGQRSQALPEQVRADLESARAIGLPVHLGLDQNPPGPLQLGEVAAPVVEAPVVAALAHPAEALPAPAVEQLAGAFLEDTEAVRPFAGLVPTLEHHPLGAAGVVADLVDEDLDVGDFFYGSGGRLATHGHTPRLATAFRFADPLWGAGRPGRNAFPQMGAGQGLRRRCG